MASFTDTLENELLDHVFLNAVYTSPTNVYLALYTANPSDAGGGTEVTNANAYARQAITFGAASGGAIANTAAVTFPTATGSWGTVSAVAILDSGTHGAGVMLAWADITDAAVGNGDTIEFAIGDIDVTLD